jgi:hypothetical protein
MALPKIPQLPKILQLFANYPTVHKYEMQRMMGGDVSKAAVTNNWETCCIRLSRSLNYSGAPLTGCTAFDVRENKHTHKVRALRGGDHKLYIFAIPDMKAYLTAKYGSPKAFTGDEDALKNSIHKTAGVLMFGTIHVDLWDGYKIRYENLWDKPDVKVNGIRVWFTGETREDPNETEDG